MIISLAIKTARESKGLSQKEVALSCKMDQAHYSRIENGKTDPSFSVVERIANALNLSVSDLLNSTSIYKEINSLDKSIVEKVNLIEQLEKNEKDAFYIMLDALINKHKLKIALNNVISLTA